MLALGGLTCCIAAHCHMCLSGTEQRAQGYPSGKRQRLTLDAASVPRWHSTGHTQKASASKHAVELELAKALP